MSRSIIRISLIGLFLIFFMTEQSFAVREGRYDITQLESISEIIIIGHITDIRRGEDVYDIATVMVISVLKGDVSEKIISFKYPARTKEIRDTRTLSLKRGKSGVFFLKSVVDGQATTATFGSIAFFYQIPTYVGK